MSAAAPRPLSSLPASSLRGVRGVFCDIDDTLTWHGKLVPAAFMALSRLQQAGLRVVPITGRPGGWVDQIARMWPVDGVVGENGGLWFYLDEHGDMVRSFLQDASTRRRNRERLTELGRHILQRVPGTALASDQPYRDLDLAIDFCEDVDPLDDAAIDDIVAAFRHAGATCKVSSIHVNGWYGDFDKLTGCRRFLAERYGEDLDEVAGDYVFAGDSANDEPMFRYFLLSVGVANVADFLPRMAEGPKYITPARGGEGFAQLAERILAAR